MSLPTVGHLCRSLPRDLLPAPGVEPAGPEITAVHVSELTDPTPYLSGGELLLTTGLTLPDSELGVRGYVERLVKAGLGALGIGLGPHFTEIPQSLSTECGKADLPLLVVPATSAFLTVTKEYWTARSRSSHQQLNDTIAAHHQLVTAIQGHDPMTATLKTVASLLGAWTALLDDDGGVEQVFPVGRAHDALEVARQLRDVGGTDTRSITTLPAQRGVVMVFPVSRDGRVIGHLAVGADAPISATGRRIALTASALLSIDAAQRYRSDVADRARRESVAALVDLGMIDAAHRLGSLLGRNPLMPTATVLSVRTSRVSDVIEAVCRLHPHALPSPVEHKNEAQVWFLLPSVGHRLDTIAERIHRFDPRASVVRSAPIALETVHEVRVGLAHRLMSLPPGAAEDAAVGLPLSTEWADGLQAVLAYPRADLAAALVSYLRHRGHWDAAARELGVHRNTLRHRITRVNEMLGADLDDADVASQIWLTLRSTGRA